MGIHNVIFPLLEDVSRAIKMTAIYRRRVFSVVPYFASCCPLHAASSCGKFLLRKVSVLLVGQSESEPWLLSKSLGGHPENTKSPSWLKVQFGQYLRLNNWKQTTKSHFRMIKCEKFTSLVEVAWKFFLGAAADKDFQMQHWKFGNLGMHFAISILQ